MADTLGTLSIAIEGDIRQLKSSLSDAKKLIDNFTGQVTKDLQTVEKKLGGTSFQPLVKKLSGVTTNINSLVGSLEKLPDALSKGVAALNTQVSGLQKTLSPVSTAVGNLGRAFSKLNTEIGNVGRATNRLPQIVQRFQQFHQALAQIGAGGAAGGPPGSVGGFGAGVSGLSGVISRFNGVSQHASNSLSLLRNGFGGATGATGGLIQALTGLNIPLNQMIGRIVFINAIWKLWGKVIGEVGNAIRSVIELDQALKNIQAVTLTFGKDFVDIQNKIRTAILTTSFSARELADAYTVLGQAGLSGKESTQAFDAVITLAAASMTSLSEAANILTTILRTYDIQASNSASVVNQLIAATNLSKLSIEGLNTALNFAGPAAAEANLSLSATLGTLATMADRGIKASTQGTGLRQVLAALIDPSEQFAEKLTSLGISLDDVNPLTNNFADILKLLKDRGFTAADAFAALELRTAGTAAVLVKGADAMRSITNTIEDSTSGLAAQIIQQQGLEAQLGKLRNKFFETFLGPGGAEGAIRTVIKATDSLLDSFKELIEFLREHQGLVGTLFAGGAAFGGAAIAKGLGSLKGAFAGFGAASALGKVGIAGAGFLSGGLEVVAILATAYATIQLVLAAWNKWTKSEAKQPKTDLEELNEQFDALLKKQEEFADRKREIDKILRDKPAGTENSALISADIGILDILTGNLPTYNDLLEEAADKQRDLSETAVALAKDLEGITAELIGQSQNLEGNRIVLQGLLDGLQEELDKNANGTDNYNEILAARIALEQKLGTGNVSLAQILEKTNAELQKNQDETDALNKELEKKKDQLELVLLQLKEEAKTLEDRPSKLLENTEKQRKLNDELEVLNEKLGTVLPNLRQFNEEYRVLSGILAETLKQAAQSPNPIDALGVRQKQLDDELAIADAKADSIKEKLEAARADLALATARHGGIENILLLAQTGEKAGLTREQSLPQDFAAAEAEVNNLTVAFTQATSAAAAYRKGVEDTAARTAQAVNNANQPLKDTIKDNKELAQLEQARIQSDISGLKNKLALQEKIASKEVYGSVAQIEAENQVKALTIKLTQREVDLANEKVKLAERNEDLAQKLLDKITQKNPYDNSKVVQELRHIVTETKLEATAARDALESRQSAVDLLRTTNVYKELERSTGEILHENKLITQDIEDRETLNKKLARQNDAEVSILKVKKDLAVSTREENSLNQSIHALETAELERQVAHFEYIKLASQQIINNNADILSFKKQSTDEDFKRAEKATQEAEAALELADTQIETSKIKLSLLDLELEKTNAINNAWRDVARTVNDGYAQSLTDVLFGDKSQKEALKDLQKSIVDSFKKAFTESIKAKVSLLDKPLKGNILNLGKFIQDNLGISIQQGISANPTAGGTNAAGQPAKSNGGLLGTLSGVGSTVSGWFTSAGNAIKGWFGGTSNPAGAVADRYAAQARAAGVTIEGRGSGATAAGGVQPDAVPSGGGWGSLAGLAGAGVGILNGVLSVGAAVEQATKTEKALATASAVLSQVAVALISSGNGYAAIVGVILEIVALILPMFAPSAFNVFFKQAKKGVKRALVGAGGDPLKISMHNRAFTIGESLDKFGLTQLGYGGDLENIAQLDRSKPLDIPYLIDPDADKTFFIQKVLQEGLLGANANNTKEQIQNVTNALSGYYLVLAGSVKHHKAFGFAQEAVNVSLAEMLKVSYDLSKIDLEGFYGQLERELGSFGQAIENINKTLEKYKKKNKEFDIEFFENSIRGLTTVFAKEFPAGVDAAAHAIRLFKSSGKVELEDLSKSIEQTVKGVIDAAKKISEAPFKIVVEGGSSKLALDQLEKQINDFTKDFFTENILETISAGVIKEGFLTPMIDQVQFLSEALYKGDLTSKGFGDSLRSLFQDNLLPNVTQFKQIMEETFNILSGTLGFPLDLLPSFFNTDEDATKHTGLTFDATLEKKNKNFTTAFLGFGDVAKGITDLKELRNSLTTGPADFGNDFVDQDAAQPILDSAMGDLLVFIIETAAASGVIIGTGNMDVPELKKKVYDVIFKHIPFGLIVNANDPTTYPGVQIFVGGYVQTGVYGGTVRFDVILSGSVNGIRLDSKKASKNTTLRSADAEASTELFQEAKLKRRQVLDAFLVDAGIDIAEFYAKAAQLYPNRSIEDLTGEQLQDVLLNFSDILADRGDELLEQIAAMNDDVEQALTDLAKEVSSPDEFAAVFSASQQAFQEGFIDQLKLDELIANALQALKEELPKAIDVAEIFESALDENGDLNVDLFKRLLIFENTAFTRFSDGVKAGIIDALVSDSVKQGIETFSKNVKRSVGDSIIDALIESITNEVFISQIFGPFMEQFNTLLKGYTTGDNTIDSILAFISNQLPGLGEAVDAAGTALGPLIQLIYDMFSNSGFLGAYQDTVDAQDQVVQKMLEVAQRWADILKQARDVRSEILYGQSSPQNIRAQISSAQTDLNRQLTIFRTSSNVTTRQDAASSAIGLIQRLFQLGNSAGAAGLAEYQKTSASFQVFSKGLVGLLDEISNAAISGSAQLDYLKQQVDLLQQIADNTAPATTSPAGGSSAGIQADYTGPLIASSYTIPGAAQLDSLNEAITEYFNSLNSMLRTTLIETIEANYVQASSQAAGGPTSIGDINITITGNATPETARLLAEEVDKVLIKSIRRGRGGVEVVRKIK